MEQCFRIALWMFVLIGHLHAGSNCTIKAKFMKYNELRNIPCNDTARFSSPTNVQGCYTAGLKVFMTGMELAKKECKDEDNRIGQALEVMNRSLHLNLSETCNFTMTDHEQFASFVNATETFIKEFNSHACRRQ